MEADGRKKIFPKGKSEKKKRLTEKLARAPPTASEFCATLIHEYPEITSTISKRREVERNLMATLKRKK